MLCLLLAFYHKLCIFFVISENILSFHFISLLFLEKKSYHLICKVFYQIVYMYLQVYIGKWLKYHLQLVDVARLLIAVNPLNILCTRSSPSQLIELN